MNRLNFYSLNAAANSLDVSLKIRMIRPEKNRQPYRMARNAEPVSFKGDISSTR